MIKDVVLLLESEKMELNFNVIFSAEHFQLLLKQYPPQTSSRFAASQWACAIHNKVNERLGKEIFNCADIEEKYPCGCNDEKTE